MSAIDWDDVEALAPELVDQIDSVAQTFILAHANTALKVAAWGGEEAPRLRMARLALAAHFATLTVQARAQDGSAGPVTQESVGDVMRQYGQLLVTNANASEYERTPYGLMYRMLARPIRSGGMVSGC